MMLNILLGVICRLHTPFSEVLTNLIVVIISQYIHISNHYVVHLKLTQCYMSIISQWSCKKLKIELSYVLAIALLGIPQIIESKGSNRCLYTHVHSSFINNSRKTEAILVSTDGWMDQQNVQTYKIYIQWNIIQP